MVNDIPHGVIRSGTSYNLQSAPIERDENVNMVNLTFVNAKSEWNFATIKVKNTKRSGSEAIRNQISHALRAVGYL